LNGHLPPGWQSYMSPQGRRYYVNTFTNGKWGWGLQKMCHPSSTDLLQGIVSQVDFDDKVDPESKELI